MSLQTGVLAKLVSLVENSPKYRIEDAINKNLLAEDARKYDSDLLNLLQKDAEIKNHFFTETEGGLVFKKDVFLQFVSNKEFLPDSFTKYKIKIGLGNNDGALLSENGDVVLNWPYKDCILEGGQDKDDQKRSEIFFNDVLAPDQITRLLDIKVFTNWKRYDKSGEHELDELKDNDNLIIKGNNLVVLHSLKKRYAGKVKLIYIDPPYNTGGDSFGYNDKFNHSSWLTFMKNRLEIAKQLLTDDGFILVHCDDNEQAYLKVLMDEVFGRKNFISNMLWKGRGGRQDTKHIAQIHEFIVAYAKDIASASINKRTVEDAASYPNKDEKGKFKTQLVRKWGSNSRRLDRPNLYYEVEFEGKKVVPILPNGDDGCWRWGRKKLEEEISKGNVIGGEKDSRFELYEKIYEGDGTKDIVANSWIDDIGSGSGSKHLADLFTNKAFDYPKPEALMGRLIELTTDEDDLVLDYHLGSGTTVAAAHKLNRRYIGIEQMGYIENVTVERLKKVLAGEQGGISESAQWQHGGSFVYCNIMNNANKFRERIKKASSDNDYVDLLNEARSSSFLSYRVDPRKLDEVEFRKLSKAEKQHLLVELVDNNTLYVNYDDINDPLFKVSGADKEHNKVLYKKSDT